MLKGTLFIFCGKMASGKSTLAAEIAKKASSVLISEDLLLDTLYPNHIVDIATYVQYSGKLKAAMAPILVDLLSRGTSVVLDFPANTTEQREWMTNLIKQSGAKSEFHYLDCSDAVCKAQLKKRIVDEPERHATDTVEMFDVMTKYFVPPVSEEGFQIIFHKRS